LHNLYEKDHRGTCIGALLTDTKITLVAGKAHLKHTEGGDFREATLRAVRHGLMKAGCTLLEPFYKFRLEIPASMTGRAMNDLQAKSAVYAMESATEETAVITGRGPVSTLHDYTREVIAYTRGTGRLFCTSDGYEPCHNADEIIAGVGYDPEADMENTPHSVFCAHGAGFVVPWQEVDSYKHLDAGISLSQATMIMPKARSLAKKYELSDEDLEQIMLREFGPIRRKKYTEPKITIANGKVSRKPKAVKAPKNLLIVDGYNVIYAWDALKQTADYSLEKAREELMDMLSDYHAFTKTDVLLVFDAYLVKDGAGSEIKHDGYRIVYTKQDQTADAYIEQVMHDLGPDYSIRVVTGDQLLQISAVTFGVSRMTPAEFQAEVSAVGREITEFIRTLTYRNG
jgi:predicted RNA-binding protein with PIN domain